MPFTILGAIIGLVPLAFKYIVFILLIPILYCVVAMFMKRDYIKIYKEWI